MRFLLDNRFFLLLLFYVAMPQAQAQGGLDTEKYRQQLGRLTSPELQEVSGLVASRKYPGLFWGHNDSGDDARIFLIDSLAQLKFTCNLDGVAAVDCEDIAWVEIDGKSHLVLADIGDNLGKRPYTTLYVFEEPEIDTHLPHGTVSNSAIRSIKVMYPTGPKDAEALIIDPISKKLIIFSKRELRSGIYITDFFQAWENQQAILTKAGELGFNFVTAADVSADGQQIIVKNLLNIYYWQIDSKRGWTLTMQRPYIKLRYDAEAQGEAICFGIDAQSFYTLSERPFGLSSYLYRYNLKYYDQTN
ncbi:hypothetical protein [Sphingobacterium sp. SYP-B4668]|uniref:hypothetical protein n=1 Tax=Sphingobacterium sp. SYP-B4668 TaxID=2996035 RepID=UPI0022DCF7F3|nr:hypothetical protein [Sphingobacterium sp. SYP-B4668]